MDNGVLGTQVVTQIGIIVKDVEKTARSYADFFGVPEPESFWTDTADLAQTEYEGQPTPARAKLAFFEMGQLQIELIQPDEGPSTWREFLDKQGEGVHHIAFGIKGMKEKIALLGNNGMPLIQKGEFTGGRYAYINTLDELKVLVELLEND